MLGMLSTLFSLFIVVLFVSSIIEVFVFYLFLIIAKYII